MITILWSSNKSLHDVPFTVPLRIILQTTTVDDTIFARNVGFLFILTLRLFVVNNMVATFAKLVKTDGKVPDEVEKQIASALQELSTSAEIKGQLNELYIVGAQEYEFGSKKCIVVYVPVPQLRDFQKITRKQLKTNLIFYFSRRILKKPVRGKNRKPLKQKRPRSRTLTAVHDAILSDLVYPAEVVGRRTRVKLDGKQILRCTWTKHSRPMWSTKWTPFSSVYKRLTGKDVVFEFPEPLF
uniref:40S ribosomal protein S7 n=1 Tax=Ditylenchus dipsaci TaxID=166011 RepID=A0A915DA36_9BILA